MHKLTVFLDGCVLQDVHLRRERTTLGRGTRNDIVIYSASVSVKHAVLHMTQEDIYLEDLNSTNGTFINGKLVDKQLLHHDDTIEIGKYRIKYVKEAATAQAEEVSRSGAVPIVRASPVQDGVSARANLSPRVRVLSGPATGREVPMDKPVTRIGRAGVGVAEITKWPHGYVLGHVEGSITPTVNGAPVGNEQITLRHEDVVEIAGTRLMCLQVG